MHKIFFPLLIVLAIISGCKRNFGSTAEDESVHKQSDTAIATSPTPSNPSSSSASSSGDPDTTEKPLRPREEWKTYSNDEYGFSFSYPPGLKVREGFERVDHLTDNWRAMATPDQKGKAVVSVPIIRYRSAHAYPRYYDVDLRIGVASELGTACAATNGERTLGTIVLNGATFNQFEFSDAAMMQYVSGVSYRTGHNGKCFAIEQIRSGSNYRDEKSSRDLPQAVLDSCYYLAGKIVKTFRFIDRP